MEEKTKPKKKKLKSKYELSQSIRKKRTDVKTLNQQIKDKSIKKNKLLSSIEDEIEELTSRFKKNQVKEERKK